MKKYISAILIVFVFFGLSFILTKRYFSIQLRNSSNSNTVQVVTSFYPLFFFAKTVGGEFATVTNLTPAGTEPHDYDPSPQQIATIQRSKLLILNGGGFEVWADKVSKNLAGKSVVILRVGDQFQSNDPHIWLSPKLAKTEVQKIVAGYQQVDPQHQSEYAQHGAALIAQLEALDNLYATNLKNCSQKDIVTSHAAFGYLAQSYGFNQIPIAGISPDEEPSPAKLSEISKLVKQKHVTVIFFETLVSPKLAETIAKETGAQTAVLNPLEGLSDEEIQSGQDYFSVMHKNLASLRVALHCQ